MSIDLFETLSFSLLSEEYLFWKKVTQFPLLLSLVFEVKKKLHFPRGHIYSLTTKLMVDNKMFWLVVTEMLILCAKARLSILQTLTLWKKYIIKKKTNFHNRFRRIKQEETSIKKSINASHSITILYFLLEAFFTIMKMHKGY